MGTLREYQIKLARILGESFDEAGLRTLCEEVNLELGVEDESERLSYDRLRGGSKREKARALVDFLERRQSLLKLVDCGKQYYPNIDWEQPEPPRKYFVASRLPEPEIAKKFEINDENFVRISQISSHEKPDFYVFDLDNPPSDWIRFVGGYPPPLPITVFVALQESKNDALIELDGSNILNMIKKSYAGMPVRECHNPQELLLILKGVEMEAKFHRENAAGNLPAHLALAGMKASST